MLWRQTLELLAAWQYAHAAVGSPDKQLAALDKDMAGELEAIAAQIIPSTGGPGAREAGIIYFIDLALTTFAADDREAYREGMAAIQKKRKQLFPTSTTIASLNVQPQTTLMQAIETSSFFELIRTHTVLGFLGNPSYGGNVGEVGWQAIGFENRMAYQPPFGYYDAQETPGAQLEKK